MTGFTHWWANGAVVATVAVTMGSVAPAEAAVVIDLGATQLLPDAADQPLQVTISGDERIGGVDFFIRISGGDGGALPAFQITPQGVVGPLSGGVIAEGSGYVFTGALLFLDTVASAGSSANVALLSGDLEGVDPNGILLTLLVDTTGITEGQFTVEPVVGFDITDSLGQSVPGASVLNGTILIVPEPGALALVAALGALLPRRRRAS